MSDPGSPLNTTHLFVELLVIGFGTLGWVLLLGSVLFGYDLSHVSGGFASITALLPVLTFAYLLGIITDRVADWIFDRWDRQHLEAVYGKDFKRYHNDRRTLVHQGAALWAHLEYGRSRLRICRGWALNSFCLLICFNLWLGSPTSRLPIDQIIAGDAACIALTMLCVMTWWKLNSKEYRKIERQATWLRKQLYLKDVP